MSTVDRSYDLITQGVLARLTGGERSLSVDDEARTGYHESIARFLHAEERRSGSPDRDFQREYERRFCEWIKDGSSEGLIHGNTRFSEVERRDLGIGAGASGGFSVPFRMANSLIYSVKEWAPLFNAATRIDTDDAEPLALPSNDDTAISGGIQGENLALTAQDTTVTQKTLGGYMYVSSLVKVSWQLLQDAAPSRLEGSFAPSNPETSDDKGGFDVLSYLGGILGERVGRALGAHLANGSGTAQPQGLASAATIGFTSATGHTTSFAASDFTAVMNSVDVRYWPQSSWAMHPNTFLWAQQSLGAAATPYNVFSAPYPITLYGRPVILDPALPVMAANARSVVFGDIRRGYIVRTSGEPQVHRLRERFAEQLATGLFCSWRADANIGDARAVRVLANSAT